MADATSSTAAAVRLSAVVACYKDAEAIPIMHERLAKVFASLGVNYEIIFVNDGSPDDTDTVLEQLTKTDGNVLAIEHSRNFGSQNAFLSGMQMATGDAVILLDGDLQDPPELIRDFFAKWREGNDVVYGRRTQRQGSALLAIAYRCFYRVFRRMAYVPIPLDAGDFSLIDRKVVSEMLAMPEADQFLRGLRAWVGFKQTGVDYVRPERAFGQSNNSWLRNYWWAKKGIVNFSFAPLELLGYVALGTTALSILALVYQLVDILRHPEAPHALVTIGVLVALFGSLNLLAVALIGEYLMKIFDESKRRPKFIRKAVRQNGIQVSGSSAIDAFVRGRHQETSRTTGGNGC